MEEKRKDSGTSPAATAEAPPAAADPPSSRRRGGGQKRKSSNLSSGNTSTPPTTSSSKRQAREKSSSAVPFPQIHNGPCTRARQQPNNASNSDSTASWDSVVKTEASAVAVAAAAAAEAALKEEREDWEALEAKIEAEYEVIRSRDVNAHVVPIPCGWFSWTKVHPLEERSLPSFFNGKSETRTPEIYTEIRNSIMNRFHANPNMQVEVKDLSELSVGELDARQEVMEFLDYWGLINYHPFPETGDTSLTVHADKAAKMDSLVQNLYNFEMEQSSTPVASRTNVATPSVQSRLLPESVVADELVRPEGPAVEYHCNSCSADCSRKRYHCQKQADFDLCTECFNDRKFDSNMSPSDFILMEPAEAAGASGGKWTDQETLLLLEALELFSENWNEIAEHVATKTKAQCILHFVQMPIEDTFLDCDIDSDTTLKENTDSVATGKDTSAPTDDAPETTESKDEASDDKTSSSPMEILKPKEDTNPEVSLEIDENCALKALREAFEAVGSLPSQEDKLSFADAGNPVMALAAFLGRLVEPNVVTALARSSLKCISSNGSSAQLAARHCFLMEDPADDTKNSADTERGVTETVDQEGQKDENEEGKLKDDKSSSITDNSVSLNDHGNREDKDPVSKEKQLLVSSEKDKELVTDKKGLSFSPEKYELVTGEIGLSVSPDKDNVTGAGKKGLLTSTGDFTEKFHGASEPDVMDTDDKVESSHLNESNKRELQKEHALIVAKDVLPSKVELPLSSGDGALAGGPSQSSGASKDEEMVSDSLPSDKTEPQPTASNSMVENGSNPDEEEAKDCKNEKKGELESKNDLDMYNIKRAAVTAISAAAVKAKLLADQEEDQIRLLATSLIEKQLHKLETKLAFFTEMESVVMRVREQLERSKQRLYHERAQIIAARLGMSGSSSRPAPQSVPSRVAMTFPNAVPRPAMGMISHRPPLSRPLMAPAPPPSNQFVPATVVGNSVQPPIQDISSSVGMK